MSKLLSVTDRKTDAIEALPTAQKILLAVAIAKTKGGNILDPLEVRTLTTFHKTHNTREGTNISYFSFERNSEGYMRSI